MRHVRPLFIALPVLLLVFLGASPPGTTEATNNFDISYNVKNCNALPNAAPWDTTGLAGNPSCTDVLSTNTVTDQTTALCIPGRTNVTYCPASSFAPDLGAKNFSSIINYTPNGYKIAGAPGSGLAALDVGELVGGGDYIFNLTAALQSIDCNGTFPLSFLYYNVALPNVGTPGAASVFTNPDPRTSTNIVQPRDEGKTDRFGAWSTFPGAFPADDPADNLVDSVAPFDVAEPTSPPIANYPKFLLDLFDPDFIPGIGDNADGGNNLPPVVPIAVYGGLSIPTGASTAWVPLYFVQFAPGQLANGAGTWVAPHPFSRMDASLGYPMVAVFNDPTALKASQSTIQDSCSLAVFKTMLKGTGGNGHVRYKTPAAAGTYFYQNWVMSQRDADGDGRENAFDTCPNTADGPVTWDSDGDGLYNSCDPAPVVADVSDIDSDGFDNRQDNCPQTANGLAQDGQKETELTVISYAAAAPDGGPKTDGMGDACDAAPAVANGEFQIRAIVTPKCIGGTDADGDGYCAVDQDTGTDTGTNATTRHTAWSGGLLNLDTDGDGFSDWQETFMGTDAARRCAGDTTPNNEGLPDTWPRDLDDDRADDVVDVQTVADQLGVVGNPRYDLNQDGIVTIADVNIVSATLNTDCNGGPPPPPPPPGGNVNEIAIDTDISGNDARLTLGADIQKCSTVSSGGSNTRQIDVVLPAPGISATDGIAGWQLGLVYNSSIVKVTVESQGSLLAQAAGSSVLGLSDSLPDTSGDWLSAAIDLGPSGIEPSGPSETGPGVLTRLTLTGVNPGVALLTLSNVMLNTASGSTLGATTVSDGFVAVDVPCPEGTDVSLDAVSVSVPAEATAGVVFTVSATALVGNLGGRDPVNVDTIFTLSLPVDCATSQGLAKTFQNIPVPVAGSPVPVPAVGWTDITCSWPSVHTFQVTATVAIDDANAYETNSANNGPVPPGPASAGTVLTESDPDEDNFPTYDPQGQVVDPCRYEAEDYDGYQTDGCPDSDNDGDGVVDVCVDKNLDGLCDAGPITGAASNPVTVSDLYLSRPNGQAAPIRPAILDNCRDTANADQADSDGDRIGNACDTVNNSDIDGDGIANEIDGEIVGGLFRDQSGTPSDSFTDQHLPLGGPTYGVTFGKITDHANLTITVTDLVPNTVPNQAGVSFSATCPPATTCGTAGVDACGITPPPALTLTDGDAGKIKKCGSITVEVTQGTVGLRAGTLTAALPVGATATMQKSGVGFAVSNSAESTVSITVNGISIAPGLSDDDADGDRFLTSAENFIGTNPDLACGVNAWPVDNNGDNKAGLSDILAYIPVFGTTGPGLPYNARFDLNADNKVGLQDILIYIPFFNQTCTP